ncbi:hypothetical protein [Actinoplanes couchii]|nr:hypothetical protein [Actinoplanes couchii]MDR6323636.1 hypothetical protein [Actinoplanes couchii]
MSAKKLGRFAGLVLALAVVFGGVSIGATTTESSTASARLTSSLDWN